MNPSLQEALFTLDGVDCEGLPFLLCFYRRQAEDLFARAYAAIISQPPRVTGAALEVDP
jgi:hypothetical protein